MTEINHVNKYLLGYIFLKERRDNYIEEFGGPLMVGSVAEMRRAAKNFSSDDVLGEWANKVQRNFWRTGLVCACVCVCMRGLFSLIDRDPRGAAGG